jgi:serine/threonine protein phosphatase PrpC
MYSITRSSGSTVPTSARKNKRKASIATSRETPFEYSWASMRGKRPDQQDTLAIVPFLGGSAVRHFFGLYDGHSGTDAAQIVASYLHHYVSDFIAGTRQLSTYVQPTMDTCLKCIVHQSHGLV